MSYVTEEEVKRVYAELRTATVDHMAISQSEIVIKAEIDRLKAKALNDGTIEEMVGSRSNAEKREAAARELFADQYKTLEEIQDGLVDTRLSLDLARINVEEVRMLMRLSELEAKIADETS